jgi:hypothetical protein
MGRSTTRCQDWVVIGDRDGPDKSFLLFEIPASCSANAFEIKNLLNLPEQPSTELYIDGKLFTIGQNLHDFRSMLYTIRRAPPREWFYADAICIWQDGDEEQAYQVRVTKAIYSQCREVYSWLGKGEQQCEFLVLQVRDPLQGIRIRQQAFKYNG